MGGRARAFPSRLRFAASINAANGGSPQTARRRPIRIEFCAADILQLFDDWRRAVGVAPPEAASAATRKPSLASHIERVVSRLIALRGD